MVSSFVKFRFSNQSALIFHVGNQILSKISESNNYSNIDLQMPHPDIRNIGFLFKKNNLQIEQNGVEPEISEKNDPNQNCPNY